MHIDEIVGFPEPRSEKPGESCPAKPIPHFDLADQLQQVRGAEVARLLDIGGWLSQRFRPDITVEFFFYQILGRAPDSAECAKHREQLRRSPSTAPAIVEELCTLAGAGHETPAEHRPAREASSPVTPIAKNG